MFEADEWVERFLADNVPPLCPECRGFLKHATISFGQQLNSVTFTDCMRYARNADVFLAIGSSLVVEPAASLPLIAAESKANLVIINRDPTPLDHRAAAVIRRPIGETLEEIDGYLA
jgi:NAD-dependent deacetylase